MLIKVIILPNIDFDTGNETKAGEYILTDQTYLDLLLKLKDDQFNNVDADLKKNILEFYGVCNEKLAAEAGIDKWTKINNSLDTLRAFQTSN